jgi:hypothetical protein
MWTFGQTYARSGGRMLLSVVQMYGGNHWMYALQTVQGTYVGPPNVRYFLNSIWLIPGHTRQP